MGILDSLFGKRKTRLHELKWKIPEGRLCAKVEEANKTVRELKKLNLRFMGGGEFVDLIHVKEFGEGIYAYYIVRTDKKTEKETMFFEGYMLEEEEKLGMEVESAFQVAKNLEEMGYKQLLGRDVIQWSFAFGAMVVNVYSVAGFGDFIEVVIPKTKYEKMREAMEKHAYELMEKLGVKKEDVVPTDIITLQLMEQKTREATS
jgi:adenylate cyclase class IV